MARASFRETVLLRQRLGVGAYHFGLQLCPVQTNLGGEPGDALDCVQDLVGP
jgi:hypothetical protein